MKIESLTNLVDMLDLHLRSRPFIFGGRPAFGDFGLWGQLYQAHADPSARAILETRGPAVVAWIERMVDPRIEGDFEQLDALAPTLAPIYAREIGPRFLAWDAANARAWAAGEPRTELEMDGRRYYQKTFKYPAHTLAILKEKFERARYDEALVSFLAANQCLEHLVDG